MPRKKGSQNRMTVTVKNAVEHAFTKVNGKGYLEWLAYEHPAAFTSLVGKCIPQAVAVDINHTILDLGSAIKEANQRIASYESKMIDVTPGQVDDRVADNLPNDAKPLKTKET